MQVPKSIQQFNSMAVRKGDHLALLLILILHVYATTLFLQPIEALRSEPLYYKDHPVHTHRVFIYREALYESGMPWGCDPTVSAGLLMHPYRDLGAKPQQVLGILLPFLAPGTVVRLFLFAAVLMSPLWTLLACRRLRLPGGVQCWVTLTVIITFWLPDGFVKFSRWGLVSFAAASYFAPYVLALFLNFLDRPGLKIYTVFSLAFAFLFLLHLLGPLLILPPLLLYFLASRPMSWQWRTALLLVPVGTLALNAFWFIPTVLAYKIPSPPWSPISALNPEPHLTFTSWAHMSKFVTPLRLAIAFCGFGLAAYGYPALARFAGRRVALSFVFAAIFSLLLLFFGSFSPVFVELQPQRFILSTFALMALPLGIAVATLIEKARLPVGTSAATLAILIAAGAYLLGNPKSMPLPPSPNPLADFIAHRTDPEDRLLVQSMDGYQLGGYEARSFSLAFGREVIGCTFPVIYDPAQFLNKTLWGKELSKWISGDLRSALRRWGIAWVFTQTEEARLLFAETADTQGEAVGKYHAFHIPGTSSRFLIGKGSVTAKVNRLELKELSPENDLIVLRYRYHPAWETNIGLPVQRHSVPEDPSGFLALRHPPDEVILQFNPMKVFRTTWAQ